MATCLVLGAGLSGLTAASLLQKQGHQVTVLDKGRGVGGRMATRRIGEGGRADHGAQFFSTKSPEWQAQNTRLMESGITRKWFDRGDTPRFVVANGMSALPKKLAEGLQVLTGKRVVRMEQNEKGYQVISETDEVWEADVVIITFPAPQALDFLQASDLGEVHQRVLASISYAPCFTVMAVLDRMSWVPAPGGLSPELSSIGWIADNFMKGISPIPTVTIQATADFARKNLEGSLEEIKATLLRDAAPWIGACEVLESSIHRWRYSLAETKYPESFFQDESLPGVYLGGDGFGDGHVEAAFLSGYRIAQSMVGK